MGLMESNGSVHTEGMFLAVDAPSVNTYDGKVKLPLPLPSLSVNEPY